MQYRSGSTCLWHHEKCISALAEELTYASPQFHPMKRSSTKISQLHPLRFPAVNFQGEYICIYIYITYMKGSWANHQQPGLNSRKLWTRQTVPQARTGMSRMASWWKFIERYINIPLIYPKYSNHIQWYPINLQEIVVLYYDHPSFRDPENDPNVGRLWVGCV